MTSQTDDPQREQAYLQFIREIGPRWKQLSHRLDEAYVKNPHRRALPPYYRLFDRRIENRVSLYREENLPLQVTEAELAQQYQKLSGAMTVVYRGTEHTLQEMARYLEDPDRADPLRRPPLPEFDRTEELLDRCEAAFRMVLPEFGDHFRFMREQGLLDLERRKGKAPGGYQQTLAERRWPFIFLNVAPSEDVRTLLHEGGHAFHAIAAREEPLLAYRNTPLEFAEVASMGMELLSAPYLGTIYPRAEDARRARRELLDGILMPKGMPWIATVDAFQHWLYTHPDHTPRERRAVWVRTYRRSNRSPDRSGCEDALAYRWHSQLHIFLLPFYYIEYGVAQLGALQIWLAATRANAGDAVARYRSALALGGSRPLPQLFEAAGARLAFGEDTVAPLARALGEELAKAPYA